MLARRSLNLLLLFVLLVPLEACGGGDGGKPSIKIGALHDWTGLNAIPGSFYADRAIKLVERQVKDMGGILDGREVKFKKYDGSSSSSGMLTAANKALYADKMPVLVWGSTSSVNGEVLSKFAEENGVLFIDLSMLPADLSDLNYTVRGGLQYDELDIMAEYALKTLNAKRVAILNTDLTESHQLATRWEQIIEAEGGTVVYKDFTAMAITDYSPYITKIKYSDPDVLLTSLDYGGYTLMVQQIGTGSLEDIKVMASMMATWQVNKPAVEGWYIYARWVPGLENTSSQKFEQDYRAMYGDDPDGTMEMMYDMLWMAIKAIELAGSYKDRDDIAAAARSGNLSLDTPLGYVNWGTDGEPVQKPGILAHVEQGTLVPVQMPQ